MDESQWHDSFASKVIDEIYSEFSKHVVSVFQVLDVWAVIKILVNDFIDVEGCFTAATFSLNSLNNSMKQN